MYKVHRRREAPPISTFTKGVSGGKFCVRIDCVQKKLVVPTECPHSAHTVPTAIVHHYCIFARTLFKLRTAVRNCPQNPKICVHKKLIVRKIRKIAYTKIKLSAKSENLCIQKNNCPQNHKICVHKNQIVRKKQKFAYTNWLRTEIEYTNGLRTEFF